MSGNNDINSLNYKDENVRSYKRTHHHEKQQDELHKKEAYAGCTYRQNFQTELKKCWEAKSSAQPEEKFLYTLNAQHNWRWITRRRPSSDNSISYSKISRFFVVIYQRHIRGNAIISDAVLPLPWVLPLNIWKAPAWLTELQQHNSLNLIQLVYLAVSSHAMPKLLSLLAHANVYLMQPWYIT